MRSWLFVPGDSERKLAKAATSGADAVIIDLEDSVDAAGKDSARNQALGWLKIQQRSVLQQRQGRWVRINALDTPYWRQDLITVLAGAPDGVVVPKVSSPEQLQTLSAEIYELENRAGLPNGSVKIIAFMGETAAAALGIANYVGASLPRLAGLTWGAEDLASALGASRKRDAQGQWTDPLRFVRAQTLLAATARGIPALEAVYTDFRDLEGLQKVAEGAAADGYGGMLAIHPDQVPVINRAFSPSDQQLAEARRIVAAFRDNPGEGALSLDGKFIEKPHLERARRILATADDKPAGRLIG